MLYAEQGNRVRQIQESEIQRYVEQGYTITDGRGTVIKETVPTDMASLRTAYVEHTDEIKKLKAQIATLETELALVKSTKAKSVGTSTTVDTEDAPKKSRGGKKSEATD